MPSLTFERLVPGVYRDAATSAEIILGADDGAWRVYFLRPNSSVLVLVAICSTLRDAKATAGAVLAAHIERAHDEAIKGSAAMQSQAWDAGMTPAERAEAIAAEVVATAERTAPLPHSWNDSRTANLLGNYATR